MNKVFKFCNQIANRPAYPAVVVFSLSFLISGVLIDFTSINDGGVECNKKPVNLKNLCTKLNGVIMILAPTVPIMAGLGTYYYFNKKEKQLNKNVFSNPPYSQTKEYEELG